MAFTMDPTAVEENILNEGVGNIFKTLRVKEARWTSKTTYLREGTVKYIRVLLERGYEDCWQLSHVYL